MMTVQATPWPSPAAIIAKSVLIVLLSAHPANQDSFSMEGLKYARPVQAIATSVQPQLSALPVQSDFFLMLELIHARLALQIAISAQLSPFARRAQTGIS